MHKATRCCTEQKVGAQRWAKQKLSIPAMRRCWAPAFRITSLNDSSWPTCDRGREKNINNSDMNNNTIILQRLGRYSNNKGTKVRQVVFDSRLPVKRRSKKKKKKKKNWVGWSAAYRSTPPHVNWYAFRTKQKGQRQLVQWIAGANMDPTLKKNLKVTWTHTYPAKLR